MMALFFGSLTQDYVKFASYLAQVKSGDQAAKAGLAAAAAGFRHEAGKNATYLTLIGQYFYVFFFFSFYLSLTFDRQ
jgi:ATP-binding cassette, subfamily B (MDR/TAP), member 1